MKTTGDLPNYKNSFYDLNFEIHDPTGSGFAFHLMETGASDITRVSFQVMRVIFLIIVGIFLVDTRVECLLM